MPNLMVVIASTRPTRVGPAVARWFVARGTRGQRGTGGTGVTVAAAGSEG